MVQYNEDTADFEVYTFDKNGDEVKCEPYTVDDRTLRRFRVSPLAKAVNKGRKITRRNPKGLSSGRRSARMSDIELFALSNVNIAS